MKKNKLKQIKNINMTIFKEVAMKKNTMTLAVVLLTIFASFQDAQAMGRNKTFFNTFLLGITTVITGIKVYGGYQQLSDEPTPEPLCEKSAEEFLNKIHQEQELEAKTRHQGATDLREHIKSLHTPKDFELCVTKNALGFPIMAPTDRLGQVTAYRVLKEIKTNNTATVLLKGFTITLDKQHEHDVASTFMEGLEKHLTQVKKESDALEVQIQKQVLGLEGVTQ